MSGRTTPPKHGQCTTLQSDECTLIKDGPTSDTKRSTTTKQENEEEVRWSMLSLRYTWTQMGEMQKTTPIRSTIKTRQPETTKINPIHPESGQ